MKTKLFSYPITIKEDYLDAFKHVNNAMYLTLYEEARWDIITKNGYGLDKILETGLAPTILEIKIRFLKEILLGNQINIVTQIESYTGKIGVIKQKMLRNDEICSTADFTIALFSLKERKLVQPTPEWLHAVGVIVK
jgi:thioesterase III